MAERYTTGEGNTHDDSWVYEDGIFWLNAGSREKAQRIAAALNAQGEAVATVRRAVFQDGGEARYIHMHKDVPPGTKLYTAPAPAFDAEDIKAVSEWIHSFSAVPTKPYRAWQRLKAAMGVK